MISRSQARVLVVNDVPDIAAEIKQRLLGAGVHHVVTPVSLEKLKEAANASTASPFALILLDYGFDNWGIHDFGVILGLLRSGAATKNAPIEVITAYYDDARADPLLKGFRVTHYGTAGILGVEQIVARYLGV